MAGNQPGMTTELKASVFLEPFRLKSGVPNKRI